MEIPKTNITKIRSPIIKTIISIYGQDDVKAFCVGNDLNSFRTFHESPIRFSTFKLVKRVISKIEDFKNLQNIFHRWQHILTGDISGVMTQFSSYPIHTLKFGMQCVPLDNSLRGNKLLINTAKRMYRQTVQMGGLLRSL